MLGTWNAVCTWAPSLMFNLCSIAGFTGIPVAQHLHLASFMFSLSFLSLHPPHLLSDCILCSPFSSRHLPPPPRPYFQTSSRDTEQGPGYQPIMSMFTKALIHKNKDGQNESEKDGWQLERENKRAGDAGVYPWMALDCKPLLLPPPLAVFFLIASWAISGSLYKWEVGGSK